MINNTYVEERWRSWRVTQEGLIGCAQTYGHTAQVLARLGRGVSGLASLQLRVRKARLNRSAFPECGLEGRAETTNVDNIKQSYLAVVEDGKIIVNQSSHVQVVIQPRGHGRAK